MRGKQRAKTNVQSIIIIIVIEWIKLMMKKRKDWKVIERNQRKNER